MRETPGPAGIGLSRARLIKNTLSQILTVGLATITGGVATIAVARILGPRGLGAFSPAWQLAVVVSVVALLGTDQLMIRELNRGRGRRALDSALGLGTTLGVVFGAACAITPWLFGVRSSLAAAFAFAGLYVAVSGPAWILRCGFHARERMEVETAALVVEAVVSVGAVAVVLAVRPSAPAVIGALAAGRLANLAASAYASHRLWAGIRWAWAPASWPGTLATALPLGLAFLFTTMLLRFDMVLVGAFLSGRQAGWYSAAAIVTFSIPMAAAAFNRSLYPVLSRAEGREDPELRRVFDRTWRTLVVLGAGIAAVLSTLATPALAFVFGDGFEPAGIILAVLAWLIPVRFVNNLHATVLNATDWPRGHSIAVGSIVVVNQLAYLLTIPAWGAWGAVWTAVAAEVALTAVFMHGLRHLLPALAGALVRAILTGAAGWLVAAYTPGGVVVRGLAAGVAVVVAAWSIGSLEGLGRGPQRGQERRS